MSITHLRESGNVEDAAYEMRRAVDSILALLEQILLVVNYRQEYGDDYFKIANTDIKVLGLKALAKFLISKAVYFIDRAAIFHSITGIRKDSHEQRREIDRLVSSKLVLSSIRLCLVTIKMSKVWSCYSFIYRLQFGHQGKVIGSKDIKHNYSLRNIVSHAFKSDGYQDRDDCINIPQEWVDKFFDVTSEAKFEQKNIVKWQALFQKLISRRCYTNRYPVLNRLGMLSLIVPVDYGVLVKSGKVAELKDVTKEQFLENIEQSVLNIYALLECEELYSSPFHFTPTQMGITCYSIANYLDICSKTYSEIQKKYDIRYFYLRAAKFFSRARQMYTMTSEYYRTGSDLYYLYDDFNDRYTHHSKSIQMMSASLVVRIEKRIRDRLKELERN